MGVFPIRVSDETRVRWQRLADAAGLSLGAWVRMKCDQPNTSSAEAGVAAPPVPLSGAQAVGSGRVSSAERPSRSADAQPRDIPARTLKPREARTDFKRGTK